MKGFPCGKKKTWRRKQSRIIIYDIVTTLRLYRCLGLQADVVRQVLKESGR